MFWRLTYIGVIHAVPASTRGLDIAVVMSRISCVARVYQHSIQMEKNWLTLKSQEKTSKLAASYKNSLLQFNA